MDLDPFSETVSLQCLLDPPDLSLHLSSETPFSFRCNASIKLSLFAFLFTSLDEDFPHHGGMLKRKVNKKAQRKEDKKYYREYLHDLQYEQYIHYYPYTPLLIEWCDG